MRRIAPQRPGEDDLDESFMTSLGHDFDFRTKLPPLYNGRPHIGTVFFHSPVIRSDSSGPDRRQPLPALGPQVTWKRFSSNDFFSTSRYPPPHYLPQHFGLPAVRSYPAQYRPASIRRTMLPNRCGPVPPRIDPPHHASEQMSGQMTLRQHSLGLLALVVIQKILFDRLAPRKPLVRAMPELDGRLVQLPA